MSYHEKFDNVTVFLKKKKKIKNNNVEYFSNNLWVITYHSQRFFKNSQRNPQNSKANLVSEIEL